MRCFTYVKRDNALEEPSERYYQTCLAGYADFNFDTRRLRHAREDARKNGKRRTYSNAYGHWNGSQTTFDWDAYRKGSTNNANRNGAMVPNVRTYDPSIDGGDIPESGSGTAASYQPRTSLVTGRQLTGPPGNRAARRAEHAKRIQAAVATFTALDPSRISTLNAAVITTLLLTSDGDRIGRRSAVSSILLAGLTPFVFIYAITQAVVAKLFEVVRRFLPDPAMEKEDL